MIPLRITLKNFMCYRDKVPTLNLENIQIACLTGNNGHGKTAIFDSITWALWGKSRSRTQEELVHQGQDNMRVDLDFISQGQEYRVTRVHTKSHSSSNGKTELNLSILNGQIPVSIMGNTIRDTEQKIINLLNMDYETFVSTSYLKQGDADHFTKSRPSERKQILAEVLDLSYYQILEKTSRDKSREIQTDLIRQKSLLETRLQDITDKETVTSNIFDFGKEINTLLPLKNKLDTQVINLRLTVENIERDKFRLIEIQKLIQKNTTIVESLNSETNLLETELSDLESLLVRSDEITRKQDELQKARTKLSEMSLVLVEIREYETNISRIERELAIEEQRLLTKIDQLTTLLESDLLPASQEIIKLNGQITQIESKFESLSHDEQNLTEKISRQNSLNMEISKLENENISIISKMKETRKRFDILEHSSSLCPVCDQPLGSHGKETLRRTLEIEGRQSRSDFDENAAEINKLKNELREIEKFIGTSEITISQRRSDLDKNMLVLTEQLAILKNKETQILPIKSELAETSRIYDQRAFLVDEQSQINILKQNKELLNYNHETHLTLQTEVSNLECYDSLFSQLSKSNERKRSIIELISRNKFTQTEIEQNLKKYSLESSEIEEKLVSAEKTSRTLNEVSSNASNVASQLQKAISERDIAKDRMKNIELTEVQIKELERQISVSKDEIEIFDELASAFGRNGIQALMIERAVPQLQETANELLTRLTENRMTIKFELIEGRTDRLSGLPSEELEISISDELGTRNYETFSGGESFRIDFAIRIALSKLLASRSGAPLPILFIDEGFGSQDSSGQEKLTEVIQSIQSEFEKIIVITHMEQMKESFEETIQVVKTESGSTFRVSSYST